MDAKSGTNTKTGQALGRRQELVVPGLRRHDRPGRDRHRQALRRDRHVHLRSRLHLDRQPASPRSPTSTATRASCSIAAIRSSSSPSTATSSRPATCCSTANCRPPAQKADFDYRVTRHTMVHEQMSRFFQGFRRDAHPMAVMAGCGRRAVGLLSRLHRHLRPAPAHDRLDPHDREDADARGHGLQVLRSASRSSIRRTTSTTRRTSCACASRCRARSTSRTRCWRARWTASSSCTPTTSRTPRPRRCGSPARPAPIRSPASRPASPACGVRRMAAPTRRR